MQRACARSIAALIALASVVPPSLVAIHIDRYGRNVPFMDEWGHSVPLSLKVAKGELTAADLFPQQNAHYLVFHNLTTVALTWSTRWNLKVGMYLSLALAAGVCALAVGLYGWPQQALWLPFSLIVFSLRQRECWLWAQLDTYVFLSLSLLATLFLLARRPGSMGALATAVAVCAIGTFSAASALAAWPVLLVALPALGYRGRAHRLVWMSAGLFTLAAFFTNYRWLRTGVVTDPGFLAGFVLAYLGSPLTRFAPEAVPSAQLVTIGALLLTAGNCLYLLRTQPSVHRTRVALSLALVGLAAGSGLLTGAGRGFLGTTQALQSRYVTQASLFWLAVVGLAVLVLAEERRAAARTPARWWWVAFNGVGVAFILMRVASAGYGAAGQPPLVTERQEACVRSFPLTRDAACLHGLHLRPETLGASIDALAAHRLTTFSRPFPGGADAKAPGSRGARSAAYSSYASDE